MEANKSQIDKFGLNFATQANARKLHHAQHICKAVKVMAFTGIAIVGKYCSQMIFATIQS